jgi:hypothetical protein
MFLFCSHKYFNSYPYKMQDDSAPICEYILNLSSFYLVDDIAVIKQKFAELACSHIPCYKRCIIWKKEAFTRPYRRCELDHVIIKFPNQTKMAFPSYSTSFESLSHAWNHLYLRCCKKLKFLYNYLLSEHCTCL